jgi:thiol-disulfide isomerase/thioredoxin
MVIESLSVNGYDELISKLASLEGEVQNDSTKRAILFFTGSKLLEVGLSTSWCPDCAKADPIIQETVTELGSEIDATFISCEVGPRELYEHIYFKINMNYFSWKGPIEENKFKGADNAYFPKLKCIPSILTLELGAPSPKCSEVLDKDEDFESVVILKNFIVASC